LECRTAYFWSNAGNWERSAEEAQSIPFFMHMDLRCSGQSETFSLNSKLPMRIRTLILCWAFLPMLVHAQVQSALHPRGIAAERIADISWVLFIGGGAIFLAVMLLAGIALFGTPSQREFLGRKKIIIGGGIAFPLVTLTILLIYSFSSGSFGLLSPKPAFRIEVTGELWWWRVRYLDPDGKVIAETANELRIPSGRTIELLLKSNDVIHSFWVPNLAGKIDMIPGHVNKLQINADQAGVFRGQCAEYCGAQHAKMAFYVIAQEAPDFDDWLARQTQPARAPSDQFVQTGMRLFQENRCGSCHTVRGTEASGSSGPDLTHIGGRQSIAAGILPNNAGAIAGWISGSQAIKPGNRMPSFNQFSGHELRALAAYMEHLQ
jgi:cytochrome c oxidase subunit II